MTKPIESTLRKNLLALSRAYGEISGLRFSTMSVYACGDSLFLNSLEDKGTSFTAKRYDQVVQWFFRQDWKGHPMPVLIDPQHHQKGSTHGAKAKRKAGGKKVGKKLEQAKGKTRRQSRHQG